MTNESKLTFLADRWDEKVDEILDLNELSVLEMQDLLRDTYEVLTAWHKEKLTPKGVSRILLNMEQYLYFSQVMESDEVPDAFYFFQQIYQIVRAMEEGFFAGVYPCAFPLLRLDDTEIRYIINLEENFLPVKWEEDYDEEGI